MAQAVRSATIATRETATRAGIALPKVITLTLSILTLFIRRQKVAVVGAFLGLVAVRLGLALSSNPPFRTCALRSKAIALTTGPTIRRGTRVAARWWCCALVPGIPRGTETHTIASTFTIGTTRIRPTGWGGRIEVHTRGNGDEG